VRPGFLRIDEADVRHSIRASWIAESMRRSLANLGIGMVDAYLLHNPERSLPRLGTAFWPEITHTFALLEEAVADGRIGCYGLALWDAIRARVGDPEHLSIERALQCAQIAAGGGAHHLRVIELPLNVSNAVALRMHNQMLLGRLATTLAVAEAYGLFVLTSASVARGGQLGDRGRSRLPHVPGQESEHIRALQFTRSSPGVGSALVGMRRVDHVRDVLALAVHPPLLPDEVKRLVGLARYQAQSDRNEQAE
jgi:aryl-alcohol dehydrogenase-like predicted oxidoreductase